MQLHSKLKAEGSGFSKAEVNIPDWYSSKKWGAFLGWLGTAGNSAGQLMLPPLILSILGQESLALWQLVSSCFFLTLIADLGTSQGVVRTLTEYAKTKEEGDAYDSARFATWVVSILYCVFFAIVLIINLQLEEISGDTKLIFVLSLVLFGLWGFFRTRFQLRTHYYLSQGSVAVNSLIHALCNLSRPITACIALYYSESFLALPIAYILCEILSFSSAFFFAKKPKNGNFDKDKVKHIFSFGLGNGISGIAGQAANHLQSLFIVFTLGATYIPIYICTLTAAIMLQRFMQPIIGVWYPALINWNIRKKQTIFLPPEFRKLLVYGTLISMLAGLVTGLLNEFFVGLWVGKEMFAGELFSWLVALQVPLFFVGSVSGTVLKAYAKSSKPIASIAIIELILICTLTIPAFEYFNLPGGLIILSFIRILGIYLSFKAAYKAYKIQ